MIPLITMAQAIEEAENGYGIIIDIREKEDYEKEHIKGAVWIPYEKIISNPPQDKHEKYYLYCESGTRSIKATKKLWHMGYNVYSIIGGIQHYKGNLWKEVDTKGWKP